jgi:hypothetical protein
MISLLKLISPDVWYAMGAASISFILGIWFTYLKRKPNKKCKHAIFCNNCGTDFTKVHSRVNEMLTEMRLQLDCARTYVSQFHNGGDFFSGESILKFSITHESCGLGVEQTIETQQGVLLTRFVEKLKLLQEEEPRIVFTNTLPDSHFKGFMESRNTIAFVLIPLKKEASISPYGYVCCEWCSWQHAEKIENNTTINYVKKEGRILNSLLLGFNK